MMVCSSCWPKIRMHRKLVSSPAALRLRRHYRTGTFAPLPLAPRHHPTAHTVLLLALISAASLTARADTTRYVVLNHGRDAGEMVVVASGDSVLVRYFHVDRNRGPRSETRYHLAPDGSITFAEARPLTLDGAPNGPAERVEVSADSVRWVAGKPGAAPAARGAWFRLRNSTPYDLASLARHLLRQPNRSAKLIPSGTASADVVAEATIRTTLGP